jgi:hypothetical protein
VALKLKRKVFMRAELEKRLTTSAEREAVARELIRDELVALAAKVTQKRRWLAGCGELVMVICCCGKGAGGGCSYTRRAFLTLIVTLPRGAL